MWLLIVILTIVTIYIFSFKDDFTSEKIEKVGIASAILLGLWFIISLVSSAMGG